MKDAAEVLVSTFEKITIDITPELASYVRSTVDAGQYDSMSEAIRDAIRVWIERRDLLGYSVEELRELVLEGESSGPSSLSTMADVKSEARRRFNA